MLFIYKLFGVFNIFFQRDKFDVNHFVSVLMKVSSLTDNSQESVADHATKVSETLYKELFSWAQSSNHMSTVNNCLLVNLGLIKVSYYNKLVRTFYYRLCKFLE